MNNLKQTFPMNGAVTSLNIWDRRLTKQEIKDWSQCNSETYGNKISWKDVEVGNRKKAQHW